MFVIGLISVLYTVFKNSNKPHEDLKEQQIKSEKDIENKATILAQKELETKALVLAEQVRSKNEESDRRFMELGKRIDTSISLAQNHTHSIGVQVDGLTALVNTMNLDIARLGTIIEERFPKHNKHNHE
jgi:hypothetical protein